MIEARDANKHLQKVDISEMSTYFSKSQQEAFRLELLASYDVESERRFLSMFISERDHPIPPEFNAGWIEILTKAKLKGCAFNRVRFIDPKVPASTYLNFEAQWGYKKSVAAGEIISLLNLHIDALRSKIPILKDFWLFDNETCLIMNYDYFGRFIGVEKVVNHELLLLYLDLKEFLKKNSTHIQLSDFWKTTVL